MNCVGIDVSKGKSMIAVMRPFGEVVISPFEVQHTASEPSELAKLLKSLDGETRVVMESTGNYHTPVAWLLHDAGLYVSVVNAMLVHDYGNNSLRRAKTDKKDAVKLANYGLDHWLTLPRYVPEEDKATSAALAALKQEMQSLAASLPEYPVVMEMFGVGSTLGPQLMAEIGDVRRFHSKKALVAFAGIDAPPCQSGQMDIHSRSISKRGSAALRRTLFLVTGIYLQSAPLDEPVYQFMDKKRSEGKPYKVYMMASANKFLRIYYASVTAYLNTLAQI